MAFSQKNLGFLTKPGTEKMVTNTTTCSARVRRQMRQYHAINTGKSVWTGRYRRSSLGVREKKIRTPTKQIKAIRSNFSHADSSRRASLISCSTWVTEESFKI
jgi:hypothetical protein